MMIYSKTKKRTIACQSIKHLWTTPTLFNTVLSNTGGEAELITEHGVYVTPEASYAMDNIRAHLSRLTLSGEELNKTFKSWQTIRDSDQQTLNTHQVLHYMTSYGVTATHTSPVMFTPAGTITIPDVTFKVSVMVHYPRHS